MVDVLENEFLTGLSAIFLDENVDVDGIDEDLVAYISGMLAGRIFEAEGDEEDLKETVFEEVLNPFLESVACSEEIQRKAQSVVEVVMANQVGASAKSSATKLKQGVVSMSSSLQNTAEHEADANEYLWGKKNRVKAMANDIIDAHDDKASAKDKRKARKEEAAVERKRLSSKTDEDVDSGGGLVSMNLRALTGNRAVDKARDVIVRNVTVSLDNGTVLLDSGELKFAYQRRYGLIGENGVGKVRSYVQN